MSPRRWPVRVQDIIGAIASIQTYTQGMDEEAFAADSRTMDAVIRQFTIIGEAARHVPEEIRQRYPHITWRQMGDFRNFAVHSYWEVSPLIMWDTIQQNLPILATQLREMMRREGLGAS